jgi:hypothetical protein
LLWLWLWVGRGPVGGGGCDRLVSYYHPFTLFWCVFIYTCIDRPVLHITTNNKTRTLKHPNTHAQTTTHTYHRLAVPPTRTLEEREQLHLLRKRVDYEKANPENVDPVALKVWMCLIYVYIDGCISSEGLTYVCIYIIYTCSVLACMDRRIDAILTYTTINTKPK